MSNLTREMGGVVLDSRRDAAFAVIHCIEQALEQTRQRRVQRRGRRMASSAGLEFRGQRQHVARLRVTAKHSAPYAQLSPALAGTFR